MAAPSRASETALVAALHAALADVERQARGQRWDADRPWRRATHVWWQDAVVVVDLHDLKARLAKAAVRAVVPVARQEGLAAVTFVTGRGRHSARGSVLPGVVRKALRDQELPGARLVQSGAGRLTLVLDPRRAPAHLREGLGPLFWLAVAAFVAAAVFVTFFS